MTANDKRKGLTVGFEGHHLDVGHPDNPTTWRICGNKTRQETSNKYCCRPAGWGTYHPGAGRCKLHGGNARAGPRKSGRYSKLFMGRMGEALEQLSDDQSDPLDLLPEL